MMNKRNCIFHVPNYIDCAAKSGSHVRPMKMLRAFEEIGYNVDVVMGYGRDRRKQIKAIKAKIANGQKYDFLYSESSTMPTVLTEKNHIPLYPNLDFGFFKFCKKNGIKIGLFYRDIHWKFDKYKKEVPKYKQMISIPMYKYDLKKYKKLVDVLYLPSSKMEKQIAEYKIPNIGTLPPGAIKNENVIVKRKKHYESREHKKIQMFYVGGIEGIYDLTKVLKAIYNKEYVYLTICCRESEWEKQKEKYKPYITERTCVVHVSGTDLEQYYLEADICCCCFKASEYMSFAVPIKLLEYTSYVTPVIATKGTEAGDFVEKFQNGFCIDYNVSDIACLLENIYQEPDLLLEKHKKAIECLEHNTWIRRAYQVKKELKGE